MKKSKEEMTDSSLNISNSPFLEENQENENQENSIHNISGNHSFFNEKNENENGINPKSKTSEIRTSGITDNFKTSKTYEIKSGTGKNKNKKNINFNKYLIDTKTFANSLKEYEQENLITSGKISKKRFNFIKKR